MTVGPNLSWTQKNIYNMNARRPLERHSNPHVPNTYIFLNQLKKEEN